MLGALNERAFALVERLAASADELGIEEHRLPGGGRVLDFGIDCEAGLHAGLALARVCLADLGDVAVVPGTLDGHTLPSVQVVTDHPVSACLSSQYAGWQISVETFFAMGSGPMRAAAAREELFQRLESAERPQHCVGVLEGSRLPDDAVFAAIAEKTGISPKETVLLIAPTASRAGTVQVVARSVETALHKLFEMDFDVMRIVSAHGTAPLPPVAADDLTGIGRTNDAILYGGRVTLWVRGDDASLRETGRHLPSLSSESYGKPFLQIFEDAGRDFYAIDPHLFSPAEVVFQNLDTGRVHAFGRIEKNVLRRSFGF